MTVLGEYVLRSEGEYWQETLIAALGTMDFKVDAARQALARSISAGWLHTERHGRHSRLRLSDETADLLQAGARRIYGFAEPWDWDGRWLLVVLRVPEQRREVRHQVRTRLAWDGFGSLGGGLWISPHVDQEDALADLATTGSVAEVLSFHATSGALGQGDSELAQVWDLPGVADAYRSFIARFGRMRPLRADAVFRAQTELVHEWRKFPFLDPDLPESLLPSGWPRARARELFQDRHGRWEEQAQEYFNELELTTSAQDRAVR
jgi:phenylacetic acid degradation operon negative regulatory protein